MPTIQPRRAGILIPVFALRTSEDLGIGDIGGVRQLIDWAAETGLGFLQFLPINATGSDSSPYNAISSVALDYLTLDLSPSAVPELDEKFYSSITGLMRADLLRHGSVNYPKVRRLKNTLLRRGFSQIDHHPDRLADFKAFCEREAKWLDDFCLFRVLMEEHGHEDWTNWRPELNTPGAARAWRDAHADEVDSRIQFHAYVQWLCFTQWKAIRQYANGKGIKLMGDIPFGISWCSADVFFQPDQFDLTWCGGAPPETYFKDDFFVQRWGQNWGIPLYRWDVMEQNDYAWWCQRTQKLTEVFDIFRIDHVLGFYRIYSFPWRPTRNAEFCYLSDDEARDRTGGRLPHFIENDDDSPDHKEANRANGDKYLRMILSASGSSEVVAEDLGTVPEYVRPHLLSLDIPGFKVCHWEDDGNGHVAMGSHYDNCAFTTYATHDHQPMKTHWNQRCAEVNSSEDETRSLAQKELRFLCEFSGLRFEGENGWPAYDEHIRRGLLDALLTSNARFAAFMLTDLFGLEDRFNVPGIASDSNWSARLPMTVAEMTNASPWKEEAAWLKKAVQRSDRAAESVALTGGASK